MSEALRFDITAQDKASRAFAQLADKVEDVADELKKLDKTKAEPKVDVDTAAAEKRIEKFAANLRKKVEAAAKNLPSIDITADSSDADREIAQVRKDLLALGDKEIKTELDAAQAEAKIRELSAKLTRLNSESVDIKVKADTLSAVQALGKVKLDAFKLDVDTKKAEREIGAFATNMRRQLEAATKALPEIEIKADSSDAELALAAIRGDLAELRDAEIGVDIDATLAQARIEEIGGRLRALAAESPDIQVRADAADALAKLGLVNAEVDKLDGKKATVTVDVDRGLADSIVKIAALGRALGTLALPAAAIAAGPQLAAIGAAAVTASGALFLIPAAGVAAGVAIGTLTAGFKNFGDAVGDNPKKAAEALAKLAPEARETALAVRELATNWSTMQKSVQNALFADTAETLKQLSGNYLPAIEKSLTGVAKGFNAAAQETAKFLNAPSVVKDLSDALGDVEKATVNASGAMEPLTRAFVDLVAVGADRLPELGKGIADAAEKFADFIDRARESGQLGEWIDNGIQALQQLGSIAGNVGSSLMSVFKAAKDSGADFLGTLDNLTQKMADFLKSGEGQSALVSLFQDIRAGVDAATPGLEALVKAVADVIQALGDAGVLEAAGRAFSAIAEEVAPMISSLGGLAPILAGILNTAAGLAPVLVPIAAALGAIKLASAGTDKLSAIGTSLGVIGREAKDADAKVNGLSGKLSGIKGALAGIGPVGVLSAVFAVDAATNQGVSDLLNHIAGLPDAAARAKAGIGTDFWSSLFQAPAASPNDRWDVRNIGKTMSDALLDTQRQLSGFQLEPITLAIEADSTAASISATDLMNEINGSEATVNINGNEVPAGFALRQVISEINAGKGEVIIDGKPMPAQDALQSVIDTINAGAGVVEINGEAKPAGEVLRDLLNRANTPGQATVPIGGDPAQYDETLRDGVGAALATNAMIPISGDPHDFQGILNNLISGVNASSGTITVNGNAMPAGDALNAVLQAINTGQGTVTINGEEMNVVDALRRVQGQIDGTTGTVTINGSEVNAADALERTITSINAGQGTVRINGDDVPVGQVLTALGGKINAVSGTVSINGNPQPATTALSTVMSLINGGVGSVTINGVTMPAQQALATVLGQVNAGSGTITVNGQSAPAQTVLQSVIAAVNAGQGTITVNGQSVPADQALGALIGRINGSTGTVTANANTAAAEAAINNAARPRSTTITVRYQVAGDIPRASTPGASTPGRVAGGGVFGYAGGGVHGFAGGGIRASRRRGMVVPGYAPGKDTVPAVISKGESVLVPELTRMLGARRILAANAEASGGRPATMVGQLASIMDGTIPRYAGGGIRAEDGSIVPASFYSKISPQLRAKQDGKGIASGEISAATWANLRKLGWTEARGRLYYPGTAPKVSTQAVTPVKASVTTSAVSKVATGGLSNDVIQKIVNAFGAALRSTLGVQAAPSGGSASLAPLLKELVGLRQDLLSKIREQVQIRNEFKVADFASVADKVAQTQRTQAALGLFGGR